LVGKQKGEKENDMFVAHTFFSSLCFAVNDANPPVDDLFILLIETGRRNSKMGGRYLYIIGLNRRVK
jgi:hypothetical protein